MARRIAGLKAAMGIWRRSSRGREEKVVVGEGEGGIFVAVMMMVWFVLRRWR